MLLALAAPTLGLHTSQTGMEGITSSAVEPFKKLIKAFPGTPDPAVVAIKAEDVDAAAAQAAIAELKARRSPRNGKIHAPIDVEINRAGNVARVECRSGQRHRGRVQRRARGAAGQLIPQTVGRVDGVQVAVTGGTAASQDFNEAQTKSIPLVFGFVLLFAFGLLLVTFRSS